MPLTAGVSDRTDTHGTFHRESFDAVFLTGNRLERGTDYAAVQAGYELLSAFLNHLLDSYDEATPALNAAVSALFQGDNVQVFYHEDDPAYILEKDAHHANDVSEVRDEPITHTRLESSNELKDVSHLGKVDDTTVENSSQNPTATDVQHSASGGADGRVVAIETFDPRTSDQTHGGQDNTTDGHDSHAVHIEAFDASTTDHAHHGDEAIRLTIKPT